MTGKILIVGAGFAGACYARTLADAGYSVDVVDQRSHIGGNAYDFVDDAGVRRHRYGPHLFHTNNGKVVEWISRFGEWVPYLHKVRAKLSSGVYVPLPVNLETINVFFGLELNNESQVREHLASISIPIPTPRNAADYLYANIGQDLTDTFFRRYTKKMWAMDLEEMSVDVVKRIPIRFDTSELYFPNDEYQILPKDGYSAIFQEIFDHPNISVTLNTSFEKQQEVGYDHTFNSMPIDVYYSYEFGELPYRSIRFHHRQSTEKVPNEWSVSNFTDDGPITRETAWHLLPCHLVTDTGSVTYTSEEPCDYRENNMERYYPVKSADGRFERIYEKYKEKARGSENTTFIGRCGTYQYLDMHQVINQSLTGADRWVKQRNKP